MWFGRKLNQYAVDSLKQRYGTARSIVHNVNKDATMFFLRLPRCSFEHSTAIITRWVSSTIIIYSNFFFSRSQSMALGSIYSWCAFFRLSWSHSRIICHRYHGMEIYTWNQCLCLHAHCYYTICLHTFHIQCKEERTVSAGNFDGPSQIVCVKENSSGKCIKITIIALALAMAMCIDKTVHSAFAECVNNVNRFWSAVPRFYY